MKLITLLQLIDSIDLGRRYKGVHLCRIDGRHDSHILYVREIADQAKAVIDDYDRWVMAVMGTDALLSAVELLDNTRTADDFHKRAELLHIDKVQTLVALNGRAGKEGTVGVSETYGEATRILPYAHPLANPAIALTYK